MAREISDNPSGWKRTLPSDVVESGAGYSLPWVVSYEVVVTYPFIKTKTHTFPDDEYTYYLDMVSVTPQAYTEFDVSFYANTLVQFDESGFGWIFLKCRSMPSMHFVGGEYIRIRIMNWENSTRTFYYIASGTKVLRGS